MPLARPVSISSRGARRRADQGGGSGSSAAYKSWESLPLNPADSYWTVRRGANADNSDVIFDHHNNEMRVRFETSRNYQIQGSTMNGIALIKSTHINWWDAAGISKPSNRDAWIYEPEAIEFKLEVEFNCDDGPIHGGEIGSWHGHKLMVVAGFSAYTSDQSGSPTAGGTGVNWGGAMLTKNLGGAPSGSNSVNLYRSGHKTYHTNATDTNGTLWKGQSTAGNGACDSLIFASGPLRSEAATGTWSRCTAFAGGYSKTDPFGRVWSQSFAWRDNFTKWSNGYYLHPTIFFGTNTGANAGQISIKSIRMLIQPLQNREAL